jgi:hypothetical protein
MRPPNGSEIGERNSADSTRRKALDIDLKSSDGTNEHWKVHVNPNTGRVPATPVPEPIPVEPARADPASNESGPVGAWKAVAR